jgi:general secretion pathway protein G
MSRGPARALLAASVAAVALAGCPKQKGPASSDDPSVRAVRTQFAYIETQIRVYATTNNHAPSAQEGLAVLFDGTVPQDPWGHPVIYEVPGPHGLAFDLVSYGADGKPGGKKNAADLRWSDLK